MSALAAFLGAARGHSQRTAARLLAAALLLPAGAAFRVAAREPAPAGEPRAARAEPPSGGRPFKALVVLFLQGGMDSWNLLTPHSGCAEGNFSTNYEQYSRIRTIAAIPQEQLLPISAPNGTQACERCEIGAHAPALSVGFDPRDAAPPADA